MKILKKIKSPLVVLSLALSAALGSAVAQATEFDSYLECLAHCGGKCTFSGKCFWIEK